MLNKKLKETIRGIFNYLGFDIARVHSSPAITLLGVRDLPIDTIIDIGANKGQFAELILKVFPNASIFCFEPLPNVCDVLEKWASTQSNKDKIHVFNYALGVEAGTSDIFFHSEHSPSSSLLATTQDCEITYPFTTEQTKVKILVESLDGVMLHNEYFNTEKNILVKMDVQGFEEKVIKGGIRTLEKSEVIIIEISIDKLYNEQADFKNIVLMLYDLGFNYKGNLDQIYGKNGRCIYLNAIFQKNNP